MPRDPYGPKAKPTPLTRPAVPDPRRELDAEDTMTKCPICETGLVHPEIAALIAKLLRDAGEDE